MKEKYKNNQTSIFAGFAAFFAATASMTYSVDVVGTMQEGVSDIVTTVIDALVNGIDVILGTIINELRNVIIILFEIIIVPVEGLVGIVQVLFNALGTIVGTLFGEPDIGSEIFLTVMGTGAAPLGVPSIGWGLLGVTVAGIGVSLITGTTIPVIGRVGGGVGSIFLIGGSMIGVWGFFPDASNWVLGGLFAVVFATAAYTYMELIRGITGSN